MEKLQNKVDNYTIEYEFLGAGAAGGGGELYDLAADGVVDIAIDQPSYQGGRMPLSNFIAIPGLFPPSVDGHRSANQALHEMSTPGGSSNILADEFSNLGVRSLMSYTDQPFQLGTKEKVTAIEDLNGQVVRTGGGTKDLTGEALGMSPTQLTAQDIHSALQSGTVDAEMTSVPAPWAFGWYDVLNYYTTNLNLGGFHCATVIGEDTLDELPSEVSDAMIEAGDEAVEEYATTYQTALEEEVIPSDKVAEEEPFEADSKYLVYETEAKATIEDAINSVADDWVQNQEEEGLAAGEALETFESLQQEYSNE
jgi:TRAP-type C4-dicarboxylate transport system substrate-binding protein